MLLTSAQGGSQAQSQNASHVSCLPLCSEHGIKALYEVELFPTDMNRFVFTLYTRFDQLFIDYTL